MKFSCQQCSTAYSVPDEKVRGKRVRIKCKKCGAPIVVEGPKGPAAAPRPVRSLKQTAVGGLVAPPDLASKIAQAKADVRWTVAVNRDQPSKMTTDEVVAAFGAGEIKRETLMWRKGLSEWKKPFDIPEVAAALEAAGHGATAEAGTSGGFDEDEATRVLDTSSMPAPVPRPQVKKPPLPKTSGKPPAPPAPAAPTGGGGFDDDEEATAVIDPERAQALLSAHDAAQSPPKAEFQDEDEATRVVDSERLSPDRKTPTAAVEVPRDASTFDDEDDITQVASASQAKELLEKAAPGVTAAKTEDEDEDEARPAPRSEPLVVVSPDTQSDEAEAPAPESPEEPAEARAQDETNKAAHFALQNEPTRIVRVKSKTNTASLVIGLLIVIIASAAGGFLASRFVPPKTPPAAHD